MASAAERTSYSWNCRSRRKADATVSFLLISAALGSCCRGAPWTLLSSSGFVTSGRCDSGGAACCEDCASAFRRFMCDRIAVEQDRSQNEWREIQSEQTRRVHRDPPSCEVY